MVKFLKRAVLLVLFLALLGAAVLFYALKVEPYRLKIDHLTFSSGLTQELRVVQVSDIQISNTTPPGTWNSWWTGSISRIPICFCSPGTCTRSTILIIRMRI